MNEEIKMENDFETVYLNYYQSIYRYLLVLTKDQIVAEEITQETFYKALKNIHKFDSKANLLTWLCTIAKNTYYTYYRKRKKDVELDENTLNTEKEIIDHLIQSETNLELLKIIHHLEEPYKEVFTLRVYGELSFKQIGSLFSKTESWARVTFYRSKLKIKESIDEKEL